jgi:dTDP-4-dehydrorhamnose reductase
VTTLLLGGDGQLGSYLRATLAPLGPLTVATRAGRDSDIACDLANAADVRELLRATRPSLIVNAAAYTAVDAAETDLAAASMLNEELPAVLGDVASATGAGVIHYSTDYVFAGKEPRPRVETDPTGPINAYGKTKLAGEQALAASGAAHLILRTAWVYSLHGRNFLTTMLRLAAERDELRVVADQHGSPTSAPLLADATARIAANWRTMDDERQGVYHLTTTGGTTWHGFASGIVHHAATLGALRRAVPVVPVGTADFPTPAQRPAWSLLNTQRTQAAFSLQLPDWADELERVMAPLGAIA